MRAQRDLQEAEVAAPHIQAAAHWQAQHASAQSALNSLEGATGSEMGKHLVERMAVEMARYAQRALFEATAKARGGKPGEVINVPVPVDALRFGDLRAVESRIMAEYTRHCSRNLRAAVSCSPTLSAETIRQQVLDVRVPAMGCRYVVPEF
jgi:hypothetical protein